MAPDIAHANKLACVRDVLATIDRQLNFSLFGSIVAIDLVFPLTRYRKIWNCWLGFNHAYIKVEEHM